MKSYFIFLIFIKKIASQLAVEMHVSIPGRTGHHYYGPHLKIDNVFNIRTFSYLISPRNIQVSHYSDDPPLRAFLSSSMDKLNKESAKLLKVDELKAALKARRSSTGGKKSDLYERLVACLDAESVLDTSAKSQSENTEKRSTACDDSEILSVPAHINDEVNDGNSSIIGGAVEQIETEILISTETVPTHDDNSKDAIYSVKSTIADDFPTVAPVAVAAVSEIIETVTVAEAPIQEEIKEVHKEIKEVHKELVASTDNIPDQQNILQEIAVEVIVKVGEALPEKEKELISEMSEEASLGNAESDIPQTLSATKSEKIAERVTILASALLPLREPVTTSESISNQSMEPVKVAATEATSDSIGGSSSSSYHVRIDNFQRPLTDKILFEWLAKTLGHEVRKEQLWMNKIKTHCYVDFDSYDLATHCIKAVTGLKVDSKHTLELVADFTDVSSLLAENSLEGKMKPNEWKNRRDKKVILNSSSGGLGSGIKNVRSDSISIANAGGGGSAHIINGIAPSISFPSTIPLNSSIPLDAVRKANLMATNSITKMTSNNSSVGVSIRGNEQVGFSTRRNSTMAGLTEDDLPSTKRQNINAEKVSDINNKINDQPPLQNQSQKFPERYENNQNIYHSNDKSSKDQNDHGDIFELDSLFRKTKTIPPLYWLPVCDEIVLKRRLINRK